MSIKTHWLVLARPLAWTIVIDVLCILGVIGYIRSNAGVNIFEILPAFIVIVVGTIPFLINLIRMRFTKYSMGENFVRIEEGILSRSVIDIHIVKINDIAIRQTLLQRMMGVGDLTLMTGNDQVSELRSIQNPHAVRDSIYALKGK